MINVVNGILRENFMDPPDKDFAQIKFWPKKKTNPISLGYTGSTIITYTREYSHWKIENKVLLNFRWRILYWSKNIFLKNRPYPILEEVEFTILSIFCFVTYNKCLILQQISCKLILRNNFKFLQERKKVLIGAIYIDFS